MTDDKGTEKDVKVLSKQERKLSEIWQKEKKGKESERKENEGKTPASEREVLTLLSTCYSWNFQ